MNSEATPRATDAASGTPTSVSSAQQRMAAFNPMHSLLWKILLACVGVGIAAALLMALLIGRQTKLEFERFILSRYQMTVVPILAEYYSTHGSWEGAEAMLREWASGEAPPALAPGEDATEPPDNGPPGPGAIARQYAVVTLQDASGDMIFTLPPGETPRRVNRLGKLAITVDDETVGWLLFRFSPAPADSPEAEFLRRTSRSIGMGLLLATVMAMGLGVVLARTLSRPLRTLTAATRAMAQGALGMQVDIRSKDELGELGSAFNQMSTDLSHSLQLRRQMTADIAHDLRTPLSVILGYTEALNDGKFVGDGAIYAILHDEALHLSRLIDDLRMLSLADAGELPLQRSRIAPRELLERAVAAHRVKAEERGVRLAVQELTGEEDLPPVEVDPERMQQVLGNLVSNALRYTPAGGEITLRGGLANGSGANVTDAGRRVLLQVQDSGSGIAAADLPLIFERFYRGDRSRQNTGESGLGLPIAKSLVEMHAGVITVASQEGQGTTFTIALPAAG